ncbi:hypothetical protein ALO46_102742 [Pseudomonas syringae pv. solidagae]|uniref:Uncharacterized protein n=2 Tax=Pseudomonas syringae group TaxID=136849 RepID=A0A3M5WIY2_9PSED|nr:hypothetical protein ALO46_102742 [Pseudomonas syringae pv. solidagae]RMR51897.1 hypothetical protein ALP85_102479 [Pseudomonas syringae pv. syringae]RMT30117.1 hypothetical protein ALP49_102749 [Pseudomonas syringae pv. solidagae]RMT40715.1 hypothetical protein ALP48_102696 [Pseudomonas syringae pv. solidagae]RMU69938.1 hypothetical protein ALP23_102419 [Pseudomonas syringae pv. apii]
MFMTALPSRQAAGRQSRGIEAPDCYAKRRHTKAGEDRFASLFRGSQYQVKKSLPDASRS